MTIVVIGALSVVVVPAFSDRSGYRLRGFSDELVSAARHAQKAAIARGCAVQLQMTGSAFALRQRVACTTGAFSVAVPHPGRGSAYAGDAPGGAMIQGSSTITFFPDGSSTGGTFSVGGRTHTVVASTGYVNED